MQKYSSHHNLGTCLYKKTFPKNRNITSYFSKLNLQHPLHKNKKNNNKKSNIIRSVRWWEGAMVQCYLLGAITCNYLKRKKCVDFYTNKLQTS